MLSDLKIRVSELEAQLEWVFILFKSGEFVNNIFHMCIIRCMKIYWKIMKKYQCTSKLKKSFSDKFVFSYLDTGIILCTHIS